MAHSTSPPSGGMTYIGPKNVKEAVKQQFQETNAQSDLYEIGGIVIGLLAIVMLISLVIGMIKRKSHKTAEKHPEKEDLNQFQGEYRTEPEIVIDPEKEQAWREDLEKIIEEIEQEKEDEQFEAEMYAYYYAYYKELGYTDEEIRAFFDKDDG